MSARLRRVQGSARGWERRGESPGLRGMLNLDPKRRGIAAWSACVPHCLCSPLWIYFSPSFSIAVDRMRLKSLIGDEKRGEERGKAGGRSNGVGERERGPSTAEKKEPAPFSFARPPAIRSSLAPDPLLALLPAFFSPRFFYSLPTATAASPPSPSQETSQENRNNIRT